MICHPVAQPWRSPLEVAQGFKSKAWPVALIAGADDPEKHGGRWSYLACEPDRTETIARCDEGFSALDGWDEGPVVGLLSYDAGARIATGDRKAVWPDLVMARYPAWLAFDHIDKQVFACGWASDKTHAQALAERAIAWLQAAEPVHLPEAPSENFTAEAADEVYRQAVADVVRRIGEGELFQANIARGWNGRLKATATPYDCFVRLSEKRGAAYGAWWQMDDHALVSNSPELFLTFDGGSRRIETRPIKGTRPRFADPALDIRSAAELRASLKDQAENLMIVDLMRNDLGRVAEVGTVKVERLYELESHPTVHHLTSVVSAKVRQGVGWADIMRASFPPGSITGAPKHQAMKVIAGLEEPRGAWCGSVFVRGMQPMAEDVATASVLIRTASFVRQDDGWHWRALAGAGITADSEPESELQETAAKIRALYEALNL